MDFERSHMGKMNLWQVEHFFDYICLTFGWVQRVQQQTHQKVMTNMLKKVFTWSEVHLSEVTIYKIITLFKFLPELQLNFADHKYSVAVVVAAAVAYIFVA